VIWIVQDGPALATSSSPPDPVSASIGDLLASSLAHPRQDDEPESSSSSAAGTP